MLGYGIAQDGRTVRLVGIPAQTMRQTELGTVDIAAGSAVAASGSTVAVLQTGQLVVYRIE
jgi:hypothetical protein